MIKNEIKNVPYKANNKENHLKLYHHTTQRFFVF